MPTEHADLGHGNGAGLEPDVAIIIPSLREAENLAGCLRSLAISDYAHFRVIIVENGGAPAAAEVQQSLLREGVIARGPLGTLVLAGRLCPVAIVPQARNLGYAAAVNAGVRLALAHGADAVWVLNADTFPEKGALGALVTRLHEGGFGMVGSRLVFARNGRVQCWGGLAWRPWLYRGVLLGLGEEAGNVPDISSVEQRLGCVSGASVLVSRAYLEKVGLMDERFFMYCEDVDWGLRRGQFRLGYAHGSVVRHIHGSTSGSSVSRKSRSRLNVFLTLRNTVLLARLHAGGRYAVVAMLCFLLTFDELVRTRSLRHFAWAQQGFWAGIRGEAGRPGWID